ncbi:MAG: hypothetical protein EPO23_13805 [Xanthobacteraceae bacterium]|nr:MAG: hypothetical protein EPO23_13805 [Xanthobacteraceae bacterium]
MSEEQENDGAKQTAAAKPKRRAGTMSYQTTRFKSMTVALRELEQFIKSPVLLETGKPLKQFGDARPRELVANWLICSAANAEEDAGERMAFHSDPIGGDGIIVDTVTGETWPTEHILVPMPRTASVPDIEASIFKAVSEKQKKGGAAYAAGKTLVVFLNSGGGEWKPTRVARNLPAHDFGAVWVVGLSSAKDGEYIYGVANLHLDIGQAPAWTVHIAKDFGSWSVERKQ